MPYRGSSRSRGFDAQGGARAQDRGQGPRPGPQRWYARSIPPPSPLAQQPPARAAPRSCRCCQLRLHCHPSLPLHGAKGKEAEAGAEHRRHEVRIPTADWSHAQGRLPTRLPLSSTHPSWGGQQDGTSRAGCCCLTSMASCRCFTCSRNVASCTHARTPRIQATECMLTQTQPGLSSSKPLQSHSSKRGAHSTPVRRAWQEACVHSWPGDQETRPRGARRLYSCF